MLGSMTRQNCMKLFMKLHDTHRAQIKSKGRTSDPRGKRTAFVLELDSLFNTGAPVAVQDIGSNRLLTREKKTRTSGSTKTRITDRKGLMSGHDKIFETRSQKQIDQTERQPQRPTYCWDLVMTRYVTFPLSLLVLVEFDVLFFLLQG